MAGEGFTSDEEYKRLSIIKQRIADSIKELHFEEFQPPELSMYVDHIKGMKEK